jgi:hypothetical protein
MSSVNRQCRKHVLDQQKFQKILQPSDFAPLGAYISDYIRVLVPGEGYLSSCAKLKNPATCRTGQVTEGTGRTRTLPYNVSRRIHPDALGRTTSLFMNPMLGPSSTPARVVG